MHVAPLRYLQPDPVHLMSEDQAYRKRRSPVKQIHRMRSRLNRGNLAALLVQPVEQGDRVPGMLPPNVIFSSQSSLANRGRGWRSGDPGQKKHLQRHSICCSKKRTHIIGAADIVEQDRHREPLDGIVSRSDLGGSEREAVGQDVRLAFPGIPFSGIEPGKWALLVGLDCSAYNLEMQTLGREES